jgi:hypothetical protein
MIRGRRFQFAGRADRNIDSTRLAYMQKLIRQLAHQILLRGGGLVVTIGSEPMHEKEEGLPLIFDWTVLEALDEYQSQSRTEWPLSQGASVIAVGLAHWRDQIRDDRKALWERVISGENLDIKQIRAEVSVGGVLREQQTAFGDILVCVGGNVGVAHLAELYMTHQKPVVPLDISLKTEGRSASERLSDLAMTSPQMLFKYSPMQNSTAAYSRLSLCHGAQDINDFQKRFFDFVSHLPNPRAYFVRLLNPKISKFGEVERFFRNVVDPVVEDSGYERFEAGTDTSAEPFLNVEIFKSLNHSSLVIADLSALRPNCFTELGYALGLGKRVIITAQEGTKLPFDTSSLPCHFWSTKSGDDVRKESLVKFMRKNVNRSPIVS